MSGFEMPDGSNDYLAEYVGFIIKSLRNLAGVSLTDASLTLKEQAKQAFEAPYVLLAHNATDDPVFQYSNKMGMRLFEMSWYEITNLHSKHSTEPQNREERERLLNEVTLNGYISNYSGVRISKTGRRFKINNAIVWNVFDDNGNKIGQAATFKDFAYL